MIELGLIAGIAIALGISVQLLIPVVGAAICCAAGFRATIPYLPISHLNGAGITSETGASPQSSARITVIATLFGLAALLQAPLVIDTLILQHHRNSIIETAAICTLATLYGSLVAFVCSVPRLSSELLYAALEPHRELSSQPSALRSSSPIHALQHAVGTILVGVVLVVIFWGQITAGLASVITDRTALSTMRKVATTSSLADPELVNSDRIQFKETR